MLTLTEIFEKWVLPVILGLIAGGLPSFVSYYKIRQEKNKNRADTLLVYESVARQAAENVIAKDIRIEQLEKTVDEFRTRFRELEDKNEALQDEVSKVRKQNADLQAENERKTKQIEALRKRIAHLENELLKNGLPVPTKDVE